MSKRRREAETVEKSSKVNEKDGSGHVVEEKRAKGPADDGEVKVRDV